ncbi:hypothetical protein AVM11_07570 [Sphingomonas melonis TY]|uniref:Uncharacterized protein n=1 Tax=Sphingomonas melonis TY TaxID=621456 RepID=A0A175Y0S0_9SPHN|nr:hypothetical protein BJP26_05895 [Sphingomonas melonis TY]ATI56594.1 hypothetical protein CP552_13125 [Sphingomonas melonis]MBI0530149.1 hypothetical protein [Sphingomonas sp. TX0522]MCP4027061.1 hypothetical protein [Sphingomonas sp.]KZB94313.1 hypothetical protein AVM11_07570 [Sphingomonas melonis TY]
MFSGAGVGVERAAGVGLAVAATGVVIWVAAAGEERVTRRSVGVRADVGPETDAVPCGATAAIAAIAMTAPARISLAAMAWRRATTMHLPETVYGTARMGAFRGQCESANRAVPWRYGAGAR